jgi:hypothetical protein
MTVWDSMNLNAPHTEREIRCIAETGADGMPKRLDGFPLLEEAITETFGARCDEYMPGCACCDTWAELDRLRAIRAASARELAAEADTTPSGTTEPQGATSPSAGLSGACEDGDKSWHTEALAIVTAEKANWPHAGAMHDGARMACNNIIRKLEARGE